LSAAKFKEALVLLIFGWLCFPVAAGFGVLAYRNWRIERLKLERARLRRRAEEHNSGSIDIVRAETEGS